MSSQQTTRLWEWALHEDNLFTNRINFLLVGESMLFAAYATLLASSNPTRLVLYLLGATGVIFSGVWLWVSRVQITHTMSPIKQTLRDHVSEYAAVARPRRRLLGVNAILGYVFPLLLLIVWTLLMVATI